MILDQFSKSSTPGRLQEIDKVIISDKTFQNLIMQHQLNDKYYWLYS